MRVEIRGTRLLLRPFRHEEIDPEWNARLEMAREDPTTVGEDLEEQRFKERLNKSGQFWDGRLVLAIDLGGESIGLIQTNIAPDRALRPRTFGIGIALRKPARGQGYGPEAVGLLMDWLFEEAGAQRAEAGTGIANVAMQTVFERLGWRFERPIQENGQQGKLYALERTEWQRLRDSQDLAIARLRPQPRKT